jgi:hypothetical protein
MSRISAFFRSPHALVGTVVLALSAILLVAVLAPRTPPTIVEPPSRSAAASFDERLAREHVAYLADPAREGRLAGSRGYREAAEYVAERFREIGLQPLGDDGTYFQRFDMPMVELAAMPELEVLSPLPHRFAVRRDFSELVGGRRGGGTVEAEVVFVGSGSDGGDYSDYRDVDARGKIVLLAGQSVGDPLDAAIRRGAIGALFVDGPGPLVHFSYQPEFEREVIPTLVVTEDATDRLIAASGKRIGQLRRSLSERGGGNASEPLSFATGARVRLAVPLAPVRTVKATNVVGLLPAASSAEGDRYVVIGGHLDGVGTDPDGTVYPGANDNASGAAVTIEVARAIAAERDRLRAGVIFVAFDAEEEGFRGSDYFVERSFAAPYRPENVLAFLNFDVVGCCGDTLAASAESAELQRRIAAVALRLGVPFRSTRGGASDHVSFARRGVPSAILIWPETGPIHTAADTVDRIDLAHLRGVGIVATAVVRELSIGE